MPRLTYPLSVTNIVPNNLNCLNGKICSTVKRWLHLPSCTADNFLYTRKSRGGLGIPCLAKLVPLGRVATAAKLSQSSDTLTWTLAAQWKVAIVPNVNRVATHKCRKILYYRQACLCLVCMRILLYQAINRTAEEICSEFLKIDIPVHVLVLLTK